MSETISPAQPVSAFLSNGTDPEFGKLLQQLSDPDAEVRFTAVEALVQAYTERGAPPMVAVEIELYDVRGNAHRLTFIVEEA